MVYDNHELLVDHNKWKLSRWGIEEMEVESIAFGERISCVADDSERNIERNQQNGLSILKCLGGIIRFDLKIH
jgi:hypothetical protein